MARIIAVRKDEEGRLSEYKLDDGRILSKEDAVIETNAGSIEGVAVFTERDGDLAIRSNRGQMDYSLSKLPEF